VLPDADTETLEYTRLSAINRRVVDVYEGRVVHFPNAA
jgi:hypothetical protein